MALTSDYLYKMRKPNYINDEIIKTIDMIYKKEANFGEKLVSQVEIKEDLKTVHRLQNSNGEDLFLLECNWI